MEELEEVQFYVPNSGKLWKFLDHNTLEVTNEDLDKMETGIVDYYHLVGLWEHTNVNENMKNLLWELSFSDKSSENLETIIKNFSGITHKHQVLNILHPQRPSVIELNINKSYWVDFKKCDIITRFQYRILNYFWL